LRLLYKEDEEGLILLQDTIKKYTMAMTMVIAMVKLLINVIAIKQNI
jgi:hypothetical protein